MSILDRAKSTGSSIAQGGKRQAKRAQLEMQNRQTERKLNREYARIGKALYPLIQGGELSTDNSEVLAATAAIGVLMREHDDRDTEIERVKNPAAPAQIEEKSTAAEQ
jgi:hypothetical protein